jgi:hypothetical protein
VDSFSQKDWFDYINKLNDRELSKRNASGITMWALWGFIAFIFIKIIQLAPILDSIGNFVLDSTLIFTIMLNFLVIIYMLFIAYLVRFFDISINKSLNSFEQILSMPLNLISSIIIITGTLGNTFIVINSDRLEINKWPFLIIAVYFWINLIADMINYINKQWMRNKVIKIEYMNTEKLSSASMIIYISLLIISICTFIDYDIWQIVTNYNEIIIFSSYLIAILASLLIFNNIYISYLKGKWLEKFEKEIIVKNMESEQIKNTFEHEFMNL